MDVAGVASGYDAAKSFAACTGSNSIGDCAVMDFDPAYIAIQGYSNEVHAYEKGCSLLTVAKYGAEGAAGVAATAAAAVGGTEALDSLGLFDGNEISIGRNVRISPFGNRDANSLSARVPHYHRRIVGPDGNTVPGGGIKWHRPWQQGF